MGGFWSSRRRPGSDDARLLAAERVHELRRLPYAQLRERADREPEVEDVAGTDGGRFRRRTAIQRASRGSGEEVRILVQVHRGRFGRLNPLAEELVVATPDGEMTGEYTLASEGNDSRRYRWR